MHGSAAPVTGTPLTRRQIREAERAREAAALASPPSVPSPGRQPVNRIKPAGDPILALLSGDTDKEKP